MACKYFVFKNAIIWTFLLVLDTAYVLNLGTWK